MGMASNSADFFSAASIRGWLLFLTSFLTAASKRGRLLFEGSHYSKKYGTYIGRCKVVDLHVGTQTIVEHIANKQASDYI